MSEVRLVRCPKCDKVLPEPSGFPVYKCGGCGAFLKAKKKSLTVEQTLENSSTTIFDKESVVVENNLEMAAKSPARSMAGDSNGRNSPLREEFVTEFHGGLPKSPMRDRFLDDLVTTSDAPRDVSRSPMNDRGDSDDFGCDGLKSPARLRYVSKSPARSVRTIDVSRSPRKEDMGFDARKSPLRQSVGSDVGGHVEEGSGVKLAPKASFNDWLPDDNHEEESRDTWKERAEDRPDQISEGVESVLSDERGMTSEGSLGDLYHGIGHRSKQEMYKDGRHRSRNDGSVYGYGETRESFESERGGLAIVQKLQQERVDLLRKYNLLKDQLSGLEDGEASSQGSYCDSAGYPVDESLRLGREPKQHFPQRRNVQRPPLVDRREDLYGYDNFNRSLNDDQYADAMKRQPPFNQHYMKSTMPGYVPGRSLDFERDCYEPYVNDWRGRDQSTFVPHKRHDNSISNSVSSYSVDRESYKPRGYDPRMAHSTPRGRSPYPALNHHSLNKRLCRPISGGAPFVLCNNCFHLLKLPGNFTTKYNNKQLQCGSCSTVMSFDLQQHEEPSAPAPSGKKPETINVVNDSSPTHRRGATTSTYIGSYDFDAGEDTFQPPGSETSSGSKGHRFTSSLPENTLGGFVPSPSRGSVDSVRSGPRNSSEQPMKIRPPPGSPLQEHLDYSSTFHISQDTADKLIIEKRVSDASETETSGNEKVEKEKAAKSPIHVLLKPLKDAAALSGRGSPGNVEVYVNGQAISQRAVKKAEKLAGKIHPGEYWYDPKAGFWGVMGHQCLGIIPPSIKEFTAPMPENCSKGDTTVYVNGRELNKRDLGLLARRGLPTTKDRHYVVDISGRVLDEETRDFIVNLGRLAPSVESRKCGFGMHVPEKLSD